MIASMPWICPLTSVVWKIVVTIRCTMHRTTPLLETQPRWLHTNHGRVCCTIYILSVSMSTVRTFCVWMERFSWASEQDDDLRSEMELCPMLKISWFYRIPCFLNDHWRYFLQIIKVFCIFEAAVQHILIVSTLLDIFLCMFYDFFL